MEQEYFGVSLEKLLTSGGQTLYMVAWSLIIGTIIGCLLYTSPSPRDCS